MRSLAKDLTIIVLSARDLFGKGYYLPRGYLRDSPRRLKEAHYLCLTYETIEPKTPEVLQQQLAPYSNAKVIGAKLVPKGFKGWKRVSLEAFKGKKVGVFCGIGNPHRYVESIQTLGAEVVLSLFTVDHCLPGDREFKDFVHGCNQRGAEALVCTEKDFVKIGNPGYHPIPTYYLECGLTIIHGLEYYEELQREIYQLTTRRKR
jgi:tetraacyldisaccharide 4'-kinase